MRNVLQLFTALAILLSAYAFAAPGARAETLTFVIESQVDDVLRLEFSSTSRQVFWPAGNKSWVLDDYEPHSYKLSCNRGEQVCYGAWQTDGTLRWGRGYRADTACKACCYTCNGSTTKVIRLTY